MRRRFPAMLCLALAAVATPANAEERFAPDDASLTAKARSATKGLGENLKAQLVETLKSGGPVAAIGVCRTIAPAIAAEQSQAHGLKVGRTSLKVRNPSNAPDAWERKVLAMFVEKIRTGADPTTLEHSERVLDGGEKKFRYMKAIPMSAQPCLACHGSDIKPEVRAEISKLYPQDEATGFAAGELRGAFTVTETLQDAAK